VTTKSGCTKGIGKIMGGTGNLKGDCNVIVGAAIELPVNKAVNRDHNNILFMFFSFNE
jgi:hypothetical protein